MIEAEIWTTDRTKGIVAVSSDLETYNLTWFYTVDSGCTWKRI